MIKHKLFLCLVAFTISIMAESCSSKSTTAAQKAAIKKPETASEEAPRASIYEQGRIIYESKCIKCHAAKNPSSFTDVQMRQIIPEMVLKANNKAGSTIISRDEEKMLLDYVLSVCKK